MGQNGSASSRAGEFAALEDGYTERGYVAAAPGQHPAVRFEFRRLTVEERRAWARRVGRIRKDADDGEFDAMAAELVAQHVAWWDVTLPSGKTLEISEARIARSLKPELTTRILEIVSGQRPSDLDPEWDAHQDAEEIEQAIGHVTPAELEEHRLKNSPAGRA